jgi:hypothetical protein
MLWAPVVEPPWLQRQFGSRAEPVLGNDWLSITRCFDGSPCDHFSFLVGVQGCWDGLANQRVPWLFHVPKSVMALMALRGAQLWRCNRQIRCQLVSFSKLPFDDGPP